MWCKTDGEKENKGPDGDVRIEGHSGLHSKGEWSEMVRHVLRRDDGHVLRKVLEFKVTGKRKQGRPKKTWKTQAEKQNKSVGLENQREPMAKLVE